MGCQQICCINLPINKFDIYDVSEMGCFRGGFLESGDIMCQVIVEYLQKQLNLTFCC